MATLSNLIILLISFLSSSQFVSSATAAPLQDFLQCLHSHTADHSDLIYTQKSESFSSILQSSIRNQRFNYTQNSSRKQPLAIITPHTVSQIQSTVLCSQNHTALQLRVRSGGHDFEGLSYVSSQPFLLIDLVNFRNVSVHVPTKSAWVQAGAVLGEVYHAIASATPNLAFPAGICPTVGIGGHISGGGYGMLLRKYGMAADNILDAQLVDSQGRVLNRASMGEDVFWAIRGGGGNTFGIVVSWKLNLVQIPSRLTAFTISSTTEKNVTRLVDRYQHVADKLTDDILILLNVNRVNSTNENTTTIQAVFQALYLGKTESLIKEMKQSFPELELTEQDCNEMSWIESILYFAGYPNNASYDVLLESRSNSPIIYQKLKAKSDYVEIPLPLTALQGLLNSVYEIEMGPSTFIQVIPHGGRMSQISDSSIPYPRRAGTMYKIQYYVGWSGEEKGVEKMHLGWIRRLYEFMRPYVSENPRGAYVNSRDLDLGKNNPGNYTSYKQAKVWGQKYYKHNFERLARVKAAIDPTNFFRNEQSVPPYA
ncbi:Tetrahydroberberine oxidase [Linum perenne]